MTRQRHRSESGFTLLELLVTMGIIAEILVVATITLTVHERIARIETQVTNMQQSLRIGQYEITRLLRMAGRGGLPLDFGNTNPPLGTGRPARGGGVPAIQSLAIEVRDNVGDGGTSREIAIGFANSPLAVQSTDILILRGCFSNLYQVQRPLTAPADVDGDNSVDTAQLTLASTFVPATGLGTQISQPFTPIVGDASGPWLLMSELDRDILTVPTAAAGGPAAGDATYTLNLTFPKPPGGSSDKFWPRATPLNYNVGTACRLEEYRFYIHQENLTLANGLTRIRPRLAMARMVPGTETPYANDSTNLFIPVADEVFDLQVAMGFDTTNGGSFSGDPDSNGVDDTLMEGTDLTTRKNDDWLFNTPADNTAAVIVPGANGWGTKLYQVRFTLVAETENEDPQFRASGVRGGRIGPDQSPAITNDMIEDHDYATSPGSNFKTEPFSMHRRRSAMTIVNIRSL